MYNNFTGVGNLAADPTLKFIPSGTAVCNFTLCCNSGFGEHKHTEFVRVFAWGKTAESVEKYLNKGSKCLISGTMKTRKWQDKDGNDRYTTEIEAREVQFLDSRSSGGAGNSDRDEPQGGGYSSGEDVPF